MEYKCYFIAFYLRSKLEHTSRTDIHLPLAQLVGFFIARYVLTTAANYYSTKMNQALEYKGDLKQLRSQYDEKLAEFEDIHELYLQAEGQAKSVFEPDLKALADELYDLDLIITLGQKAIGSEEKTSRINRLAKNLFGRLKHLTLGLSAQLPLCHSH